MIRKIFSDKVFKATSILFVFMMFGNVSNFLYQAFMSRALSVEEFGTLNSLLSLCAIVSLPIQTLHTTVANITAHLKARQAYHTISQLFYRTLRRVFVVGICGIAIFALFSGYMRNFFNIDSIYPLLAVGLAVLFGFFLSVNYGILQGLQKFKYFGAISSLNAFFKLLFGALLVYLGLGVEGALGGFVFGSLVVFCYSTLVLRTSLVKLSTENPAEEPQTYKSEGFSYSIPVLIALLCFTVLTNVDLVLVKHFFSPEQAGRYAVAAVLGKVVLFLPAAIVLAMFPMASESHALKTDSYNILKNSLLLAALLSGCGVLAFLLRPELLVTILMGAKHASGAHLVRSYSLAMLPFVFINILMFFNLATHRMKFLYTFIAASLAEILLIYVYHNSLQQVIYILIGTGCTLLIVNAFLMWVEINKNNSEGQSLTPADTRGEEHGTIT